MQTKAFFKPFEVSMPVNNGNGRRLLSKTLLLMRLTGILLIAGILNAHATGYSQNVTLSEKDAPLQMIFSQIKKQTGFTFFYNESLLANAGRVSVHVKNAALATVLDICFRNQPLVYSIVGSTVVIKTKMNEALPQEISIETPPITITGRLVNSKNDALANATVTVKRTQKSVATDASGSFTLMNVQQGDVLIISFIGYKTQEITIESKTRSELLVVMQVADNPLDVMIIQAYGTTDRRHATGNIVKVSAEEIGKQPVMNPLLALSGRVPGLVVTPASGYTSGSVKVEIRGRKNINVAFVSDPLYIVDGVPLTTLDVGNTTNYDMGSSGFIQNGTPGPAMGQSPLFSLNPADIESMEVLKDADATAIYGSRGANGVILITTKKGTAGPSRCNISASQGISLVTRHWDMLNTPQYLQMRREAFKNSGDLITNANAPDLMIWDTTRYTDWQDELWGNAGKLTDIAASVTGGDARTQFRISSNYHRQTEILTNSGANQRASLSFNLSHASVNRKFKMDFTANYSYANVNAVNTPGATSLPPNAPPIYNSQGALNFKEWNDAGLMYNYPFAGLGTTYSAVTNFITANMILRYEIVRGVEFSTSFGYNNSQNTNRTAKPIAVQNPFLNPTGEAFAGSTNNNNWIIEPQLNYKTMLGKGKLSILAGATAQVNKTRGLGTSGYGYTNDALIHSIALAPVIYQTDNYGEYNYMAAFGRVNYNWENKYIISLNGRRDGSSRFGPGKQFGNFGSAGLAWIASQEKWLQKILPEYISFVKLRGSYGLTGSDAVGDYQYLSRWSSSGDFGSNYATYGGTTPLINQQAVNTDYHWQVNKKLEVAVDLGFMKDKINLELAYYKDVCDNQLTRTPLPVYTGFSTVTANWPATVQNSGWEFTLSAKLVENKKFTWSVNLNGAVNDNVLKKYPGIELSPYALYYKVGTSLNIVQLLRYTGVDPQTGEYTFFDRNNDGMIQAYSASMPGEGTDDKSVALNRSPRFTGGFGNDFSYGNFRLGLFFSFKKQKAINAYHAAMAGGPGTMTNLPVDLYNERWQKPGDNSRFGRLTTQPPFSNTWFQLSDGAYTDASFIRLSNVSLSYSLPQKLIKRAGIQQCTFFVYGQNAFVITKYAGLDPEGGDFGTLPPAKMFTCGINFNF